MDERPENSQRADDWIGAGVAVGAAVFVATNEPVWIALGVAMGAALGWQKSKEQDDAEQEQVRTITGTLRYSRLGTVLTGPGQYQKR